MQVYVCWESEGADECEWVHSIFASKESALREFPPIPDDYLDIADRELWRSKGTGRSIRYSVSAFEVIK